MKVIIYTQRVEIIESYGERRDCADQEIAKFIWDCGYIPIPINNVPSRVSALMENTKPNGIMLTGGNDLAIYGGNAPERDETERRLIEYGIEKDVPIYGFCRGMQMIASYFGAELTKVDGHVAARHKLIGDPLWNGRMVNSFHNMAVREVAAPLVVEAKSEDGIIEVIKHKDKKIYATMWHPEREKPYVEADVKFVQQFFNK